jgi:hypothetical protein
MVLLVVLSMMGGEEHRHIMHDSFAARDLQYVLAQRLGVRRSQVHLLTASGQSVHADASLLELVDFALADMLDPEIMRHVQLELGMVLVVSTRACMVCAAPAEHRCERCRKARYCSRACFKLHWPEHRLHCAAE